MEGSKEEAVFDAMNLNPQLFINATLNAVDDVLDEAFDFYTLEASNFLKIDGPPDNSNRRSRELSKGIDRVRGMIESDLDYSLKLWEDYCVRHTFAVPQDFVLPQSDNIQPLPNDQELDSELDSLRRNLHLARNRSVELNSELQALERKSVSNQHSARLVDEALKLFDESSVGFKEMTEVASELRTGINWLKTRRMNAGESAKAERLNNNNGCDFSATAPDGKIEDLDKFLAELKKM
ncbi:Protein MIS12 [Hirschfeldia incana]|nr:Protein MIS12 [Hirschfeldia incana]